jgi:CheY-like chemotaxis protein
MRKALILSDKSLISGKEEKALAKAGVQVEAAAKFNETLLQDGGSAFDIIVINDPLRDADVFEVCKKFRSVTGALTIILGNLPEWTMWGKGREIGFDRYYKKPLSTEDLITKIRIAACEMDYREKTKSGADDLNKGEASGDNLQETTCITEQELNRNPQNITGSSDTSNSSAKIWQDPKVAGLLNGLLSGKIKQLAPEIDIRLEDGFSYREADAITGMKGKATASILESLLKEGLLLKQDFEKILQSPAGSFQLIPVERCPQCDSPQLNRGQLIEHFNCGYIGLEEEFLKGPNQVCPKCKRELKLIGTDYRKPGMRYVCSSCKGIFPFPVIKFRCLRTGEVYRLEELREVPLFSYRLNEANKKRLEFELQPKRQLIDFLKSLGYEIQEAVQVQGKSGATHTIDLLAKKDDLLIKHTVAIGILAASDSESSVSIDALFGFDSKVYDAGIENKMVIAVPAFTAEALKFAERQGIRVYGLEDLRASLYSKTQETEIIDVTREKKPASGDRAQTNTTGPRGWLKGLLEERGYHVEEKLKVTGRSGAEHILDIYAEKDDGIINHKLAACIITNEEMPGNAVNEVIQFDSAAYDAHIRDKIIISVPGLSKEARQFAEYQHIKILEAKELTDFTGHQQTDDAARHFSSLLPKP